MESSNKGTHNSDTVVPLHETPPLLRDHHVHAPKMHLAITSSGRPPLLEDHVLSDLLMVSQKRDY